MEGISIYAPAFRVAIDGTALPQGSITGIEIDEDLESPGMFSVSLAETGYSGTKRFTFLEDGVIYPGAAVEIIYGYSAGTKQKGTFTGRVKAISPGFQATGVPTIGIQGYNPAHDLQNTHGTTEYTNMTYAQIAEEIALSHGLGRGGIEPTTRLHPKVTRKKNQSDYDLLRALADEIGYEFYVRGTGLSFRAPKDAIPAAVSFTYGENIRSFSPRLSTAATVNQVTVTGWSEKDKSPIKEGVAVEEIMTGLGIRDFGRLIEKSGGKKVDVKLEGRVVGSGDEARELALRELRRRNSGFITGSLECAGDPGLRPGMTVEIGNVGGLFSGTYYVTKARHALGEGGYSTTLDVRRCL
jgi:phage protein D